MPPALEVASRLIEDLPPSITPDNVHTLIDPILFRILVGSTLEQGVILRDLQKKTGIDMDSLKAALENVAKLVQPGIVKELLEIAGKPEGRLMTENDFRRATNAIALTAKGTHSQTMASGEPIPFRGHIRRLGYEMEPQEGGGVIFRPTVGV